MTLWLTVQIGISDPDFVLVFLFSPLWMNEAAPRSMHSINSINEDKVLMMMHVDLQKRFPIYHVCPRCLTAILCGSAFLKNGLAILQELDEVGMTLCIPSGIG